MTISLPGDVAWTSHSSTAPPARRPRRSCALRPSAVYDTFWRFAAHRQAILFRRLEGRPQPWTSDPVLVKYKFTNVYRASDRVSQYLIRHVIYRDDLPNTPDEVFFRIIVFKLFNKIETWQTLESEIGPLTYEDYRFERYNALLSREMDAHRRIYSAAYIMPSGRATAGRLRKHGHHLSLLGRMMADGVPQRVVGCGSMRGVFDLLRSYPGIGDFLAYQYAIDINYSELTDFPESDFVVAGPGACDGIRKCFVDCGDLNPAGVIEYATDRQEREFERLGLHFQTLWGRHLQLVDCQNLFCEVGKYARVRHPEVRGISGRLRIKQRFAPTLGTPSPWYPPKWTLNDRIDEWAQSLDRQGGLPRSRG